jgi:queuine/archaeosine tRNA-ribosyltransferase
VNLNFWDLYVGLFVLTNRLENPGETVIDNFKKHLTEKGITNNALHEFLNFNNYPLYINIRDPQYPQQTCQANEKCIFGDTEGGRKKSDVESFYRYINALKPDLFTAMHDASTEDAPIAAAKPTKKMTKSFERTKKWIPQTKVENMITPLVGGQYVELKKKCIPWTSQGSGIHLGEISNVEPQKRYEILTSTIDLIENEQLVRFISGQDHPCKFIFTR